MIAIIGAMQEEIDYLLNNMTGQKKQTIAHCDFYTGKLTGQSVVLLKSGIGKVNAAMATTILQEKFRPRIVINTGSAGGYSDQLNVGDLVISEDVVYHDVDVTSFNYAYGQVPGMPETFRADQTLLEITEQAIEKLQLPKARGTIATGDSFMNDPERVKTLNNQFQNLIAFEMEAAAVAQVCHQYDTPFVVIRALSDIAGKESTVTFDEFLTQAAINSSKIVIEMIYQLGNRKF